MANLGSLVVSLEANVARFESDLGKAEQIAKSAFDRIGKYGDLAANTVKGIGLAMAGLGAGVGISTLVGKFEEVTHMLASLQEMSEKTGASVENLSALAYVAKIAGQSMEVVELGSIRLSKALAGADDEAKGAAHALADIGLSAAKLRTMDSADALKVIADRLNDYRDGAGKTALMLDVFGKSGAQLLPVMKALAENGDLVAKTTAEQALQAKIYEENVRRLTATKEILYKVITAELLPVMNDFLKMLLNVKGQTDGVQKAVKDLAADGSIKSWAETGAMAVAHLLDEFQLIKALAIEVATPIERIGRNIYTVGALAGIAVTGSLAEKKQAYADLKAENEKYFADLDARLAKNREPMTLFADRLKAVLGSSAQETKDKIAEEKEKPVLNHTSRAPSPLKIAGIDASPFDSYVRELDRMIAKQDESEYSAMHLKLEQLALKEGISLTSAAFTNASAKVDDYRSALENNKISDYVAQLHRSGEEFQFQSSLIYKSVSEQETLTIARNNFLDVENRIAEAERAHLPYSIAAQDALRAASAQATVDMIADLDARRAAEEDWTNGATRAYNTYMETARNVAKKTEDIFTEAYKGIEKAMSDFLFDPFDKGVKGMLQSFGSIVKRMIADAVAADLNKKLIGAVGPAGSNLTGMIGAAANLFGGTGALTTVANAMPGDALDNLFALAGNFKSFDVGTDYVPRDMFAKIHQGEKIIPAAQNTGGAGTGSPVNITVHVNGTNNAPDVRRAAGQGAREALSALSIAKRYG